MDYRATDDPRLLGFRCLELCGELEELLTARGGVGKGLGEKIHSLKSDMPYELVGRLLKIVSVRNTLGHEAHKRVFAVAELRGTIEDCERALGEVRALPRSGAGAGSWMFRSFGTRRSAWSHARRPGPRRGSFSFYRRSRSSTARFFVFLLLFGGAIAAFGLIAARDVATAAHRFLKTMRSSSLPPPTSYAGESVPAPLAPGPQRIAPSPSKAGLHPGRAKAGRHSKPARVDEGGADPEAPGSEAPVRAVDMPHLTPEEADAVLGQ